MCDHTLSDMTVRWTYYGVQESELQGCMSVDSVSMPAVTRASNDEKRDRVHSAQVLGRVIEYLIGVAVDASRSWKPFVEPAITDVQLIEVAVEQIIKMIEQWRLALDYFLAYPGRAYLPV